MKQLAKVTTTQVIKSALALPWPAALAAGHTPPARLCPFAVRRNNKSGLER